MSPTPPSRPSGGTPARPPACSRCGRVAPSGSGPFCPYCGRYLAALAWVAEPPPDGRPRPSVRPRFRYTGPPRYREVPRWGFPPLPWRGEPEVEHEPALERARRVAHPLDVLLRVTAAVAVVAGLAEILRYVLLLLSRSDALPAGPVAFSDAAVAFGGWASLAGLVGCGVLIVLWTLRAREAAAERTGTVPSRPVAAVVAGWVVPGLNLSLPGSLLAEIEHAGLDRPPAERPRPSRLLLVWWAMWAAGVVLGVVVFLWSFRAGVQAMADGVVLHAVLDLLAAATALVTVRVLRHLMALLEPARPVRRETLVAVRAPGPAAERVARDATVAP
ncbi:DUF4328 domain-containing protein [Pseudonocardia terrae]|uniref:DUF4328 domain-containing protein n=1 Tax=Pseudonocardia terrae TaxID=2905831 RepID=UPI001E63840B|nr:DUF4328 domain-containing protein [Pseudonocardia terrae]